ncbi:MAG TPA: CDC48 family AAA ATPase [Candidatus Thermoplasmatota archaeon]
MASKKREKLFRVVEAKSQDVGRGIARIDPALMEILNLKEGDTVLLEGEGRTAVTVGAPDPEDTNRGTIRIDGPTRRNANAGIDEKVSVRKVTAKRARKVTLAPTQEVKILGGEKYLAQVLAGRVISRGDVVPVNILGNALDLVVTGYSPTGDAVRVTTESAVVLSAKPVKQDIARIPTVSYEDIGGLREEIRKVREMVELPLRHPELFERVGVEAPKGVLLHGPPGTGKTMLAKAVASETLANFVSLSGPEVMSKFYGESEERLRTIFEQAEESAPSIIFIDEVDSIAPKRDEVQGETERRIVAQLLTLLDGLKTRGKVVVIAATNRPNSIDPALRRPGRFDREIEIGMPDKPSRFDILQIHTRGMPLSDNVDLREWAAITHGFAGADLFALAKEAGIRALRRALPDIDLEQDEIPAETLDEIAVTRRDFEEAMREMQPSALREVFVESPNVSWDEVGGLDAAKRELQEAVEWPIKHEDLYRAMGAKPPKGVLLYGPPGTGKTLLAKAVATEAEANFISVKGPEFLSKWVGESERAVREVFRKARLAAPCIIFLDEIDAVVPQRGSRDDAHVTENIISTVLTEMDGLIALNNVTVIAATNRPDIIDPALLRPGRFDRLVYVAPPTEGGRLEVLKIHTAGRPLGGDVDLAKVASVTEGYTGADLAAVCNEATMIAIREIVAGAGGKPGKGRPARALSQRHFEQALQKVRPLSPESLKEYAQVHERMQLE